MTSKNRHCFLEAQGKNQLRTLKRGVWRKKLRGSTEITNIQADQLTCEMHIPAPGESSCALSTIFKKWAEHVAVVPDNRVSASYQHDASLTGSVLLQHDYFYCKYCEYMYTTVL